MQKASKPQKLDLPKSVLVGDLFKVRADSKPKLAEDCAKAGYEVDLDQTFTAIRNDHLAPGSRERVWTDKAPHCFYQADIVPAWETDTERYRGLSLAGWEMNRSGNWVRKRA